MTASEGLIAHTVTLAGLGRVEAFVGEYKDTTGAIVAPLAMCYGDWQSDLVPLIRIQSSCVYGEVFSSIECDCRKQLDDAINKVELAGAGIVVHLSQEGRGAGLVKKALGYQFSQREHVDSFTAYERLGFEVDSRDYTAATYLLADLGVGPKVRLITNNPSKRQAMESAGFEVERIPSITSSEDEAELYLRSKRLRGHLV